MDKLLLKVCGMRDADNIAEVANLKPDYLGFIFYAKSKRFVGDSLTIKDLESLDSSIKRVGVFVDAPIEEIKRRTEQLKLNAVQLHGQESPAFISKLSMAIPSLEVIKVFSISDVSDLDRIEDYEGLVKYFLLDTKTEGFGGSGKKFNWGVLHNYTSEVPFFLSGGIGVDDIDEIIELSQQGLNIVGIDINSKVESEPGLKDIHKVKQVKDKL